MDFLDKVKSLFAGGEEGGDVMWLYVRCDRCSEPIKTRLDLRNALSPLEGGEGYFMRKTMVGSKRHCFERIEVELTFDSTRRLISKEIRGGQFITAEEYEKLMEG